MEMKLVYVAPAVESCRVVLEGGIAAVSVGRVSATQVKEWDEGGSPISLGVGTSEGDMYLLW
jgi:hypothetical protein